MADRLSTSFLEFVCTGTHELDEAVDAAARVRHAAADIARPPDELSAQLPEHLLLHQASTRLMERLVVNLVDNAPKPGSLPVQVRLSRVGQVLHPCVIDGGPGLPSGAGDRLPEAFARGDPGRGVPGFGLGLAIVHQFVSRLQGQSSFEASPAGHAVLVVIPSCRGARRLRGRAAAG